MEEAIRAFINELEDAEIPLHSLAVIYKNELIHEEYFAPFKKHMLHRMYSISKSFVSLAIGFLCREGKLRLSNRIVEYFPEYVPEDIVKTPDISTTIPWRWLYEMTIEDMLKMQSCHQATTYKSQLDRPWVQSFFTTRPHHEPGTIFSYDTSASHVLCSLAERLSGKEIMEYLRTCFLDKIGFSEEAYFIRNQFGEALGGSGLMARTDDLVKFAKLLMTGGRWNGEQLLPEDYLSQAVACQTPNRIRGPIKEERQGYGYQFWRLTHGGYGCYGKGGQFVLCYPEYELAVVTTADTMGIQGGNQAIYNSLYRNIFPVLEDGREMVSIAEMNVEKSADNIAQCTTQIPWGVRFNSCDISCLYGSSDVSGSLQSITFYEDRIIYCIKNKLYELPVSWQDRKKGCFPVYGDECVTQARWLDGRTLCVKTEFVGENLSSYEMQATIGEGSLTCYQRHTQEVGYEEFKGWFVAEP